MPEDRSDLADGMSPEQLAELLRPAPAPAAGSPEGLPPAIGERFEVRGVLGEGGQGVVLAVRDLRLERDVAAKMPRAGRSQSEGYVEREARLAASLEHPSILPVYDLVEAPDGSPLMVMRRAPGRSMEDALQATDGPRRAVGAGFLGLVGRAARLRVFLQLAEAIGYAHSRGVLHLDIKPANVRLGDYGEVFVMDWGLARRVTDSAAPVGGTPPYLAPEILDGLVPDERADVYSLGVMLYRLLSGGRLPFDGDLSSVAAYRGALQRSRAVPLAERAPDAGPDLAAVADRACCVDRQRRYRKVRDLVADVEAAMDGRPVTARQAALPELLARFLRRHARLLAYAAVAALIALAAVAYALRERQRRDEQRRRAEAHRLRARARIPLDKGWDLAVRTPPDYPGAELNFRRALEIDPLYAEARYARGRALQAMGRHDEALAEFRSAADADPSLIMARYYAGKILMEHRRDAEGASAQFAAMREVEPHNEYSRLGEGWLATLAGRWQEALDLSDAAAEANPDLPEIHDLRGYVYSSSRSPLRSPPKAVAAYTRLLASLPDHVTALNNRAYALIQLGRTAEAERDLDRALGLDPDYVPALTNRGWLRSVRGDQDGALGDLNRAQRRSPGYAWVYIERAGVHERRGDLARAREDYVTAAGLEPRNPVLLSRRAGLEMRAADFASAAALFEKALLDAPGDQRLRRRLGLAVCWSGDLARAEQLWRTDLRLRAPGTRLYSGLLLWRLLAETGRREEAGRLLLELAADARERANLRAAARYCAGRASAAQALAAAGDARELCESAYYLGTRDLVDGRFGEAVRWFELCRHTGQDDFTEYLLAGLELGFLGAAPGEAPGARPDPAPPGAD